MLCCLNQLSALFSDPFFRSSQPVTRPSPREWINISRWIWSLAIDRDNIRAPLLFWP
jgi:hypothetical protein